MRERVPYLVTGKTIDFIGFNGSFAIVKMKAAQKATGKTLARA